MRYIGLTPFRYDGDMWMRMEFDTSNLGSKTDDGLPEGERYYKYIIIHVDYIMVASRRSDQVMQAISHT